MHELSIANQIVETLTEELADEPGRIVAVGLDVGVLSGVVPDALLFAWDIACEGSRLAGSELQVNEVRVVARCGTCHADRTLPSPDRLRCPACGEGTPEIIAGQDLRIRTVELAPDGRATTSGPARDAATR